MKTFLCLSILLFSTSSFADRGFAFRAMAQANSSILASPPLPMVAESKGVRTKVKLAYLTAETDYGDDQAGGNIQSNVDYSGVGLASMLSNSGKGLFGWYLLFSANKLSGDFSSNFDGNDVSAKNAESTFFQAGLGGTLTMFRKSMIAFQVFGGPNVTKTSITQDITSGSGDDFTMEVSPTIPGYTIGAQVEIRLSKSFVISPYFIKTEYLSSDDKCQKFDTQVRSFGALWDLGDPNCQNGQDSSTSQIEYDTSVTAFGVNLKFPSIGLTVNVLAETEDFQDFQGAEQNLYAIGITF